MEILQLVEYGRVLLTYVIGNIGLSRMSELVLTNGIGHIGLCRILEVVLRNGIGRISTQIQSFLPPQVFPQG